MGKAANREFFNDSAVCSVMVNEAEPARRQPLKIQLVNHAF